MKKDLTALIVWLGLLPRKFVHLFVFPSTITAVFFRSKTRHVIKNILIKIKILVKHFRYNAGRVKII